MKILSNEMKRLRGSAVGAVPRRRVPRSSPPPGHGQPLRKEQPRGKGLGKGPGGGGDFVPKPELSLPCRWKGGEIHTLASVFNLFCK